MPISSTDIKVKLSGGAGNTDPLLSLGGVISTTDMPTGLFDRVTSDEAVTGDTEYRAVYITNTHATLTLTGAHVWLPINTTSADTDIQIGLGTSAINGTEQTIANENTAPVGVTFGLVATEGVALVIGDLAPGATKALWYKRTVNPGAAASNDSYTLRVKGDTLP